MNAAPTSHLSSPWDLQLFVSDDAKVKGNRCIVHALSHPTAEMPPDKHMTTQCGFWHKPQATLVQCWTNAGLPINCCGHGLLACGYRLLHSSLENSVILNMNGSTVNCLRSKGLYWLVFSRFSDASSTKTSLNKAQTIPVPDWTLNHFSNKPEQAAIVGPDNGYIILRWPKGYPLESLPVPAITVQKDTNRALIVTAASHKNATRFDENITFRYFAPQYGVAEDAATGSAMRVLAEYWQQVCGIEDLIAYQCSPAGGLLFSQLKAGNVMVGGHIKENNNDSRTTKKADSNATKPRQ